ncbi:MAG: LCP family protein [Spirochaetia bacterium]|nr:LCP family protein [Spirochaetia bacterium]
MNQRNTDTLIIANLDLNFNKATLISIPRDLFYKRAKINSIFRRFGPKVLENTISEITGLRIDKYVMVDMYAFAELVNVLGGIDVELTEPLVDPTYRVRDDNGKWSTLYYPAGVHHVNGVQALRIARARHYTPAFSRDMRQQQILRAVKDKLLSIGLSDINCLGRIIKLGFKYVETDISWLEAFSLYRSCQDITLHHAVLNTDNVLYATYTNLLATGLSEDEVAEDFDKGAWIVMPLDNDWKVIKKFIEEKLAE